MAAKMNTSTSDVVGSIHFDAGLAVRAKAWATNLDGGYRELGGRKENRVEWSKASTGAKRLEAEKVLEDDEGYEGIES